jgi:uncharacterized protein (DUF2236 family)
VLRTQGRRTVRRRGFSSMLIQVKTVLLMLAVPTLFSPLAGVWLHSSIHEQVNKAFKKSVNNLLNFYKHILTNLFKLSFESV